MGNTTKSKIRDLAEKVFFNEINPNLDEPILYAKDKEIVIKAIENGLTIAVNQGRKW